MKQKTAMQLAIEDIEDLFKDEQSGEMILARMQVIKRLEFRLTTEREQIEEAYKVGREDGDNHSWYLQEGKEDAVYESAFDYYQQKYGDEK